MTRTHPAARRLVVPSLKKYPADGSGGNLTSCEAAGKFRGGAGCGSCGVSLACFLGNGNGAIAHRKRQVRRPKEPRRDEPRGGGAGQGAWAQEAQRRKDELAGGVGRNGCSGLPQRARRTIQPPERRVHAGGVNATYRQRSSAAHGRRCRKATVVRDYLFLRQTKVAKYVNRTPW